MVDELSEAMQSREDHYESHFGPLTEPVMHSTDVKTPHVDVYRFGPSEDRPFWTLITGGMSDVRQPGLTDDTEGIAARAEIMMYVQEPENWMFNVLKGLAEMPFDDDTHLHWYHTVQNGQPMTAEPSKLTAFFFLPPYFESEDFDTLEVSGDAVNVLWLVPITEQEREYAVENGGQALEDIFDEMELEPVVDESRDSLV